MPKRYLGNIITDTPTAPAGSFATSAASGVWSVAEANAYTKAGLWPIAGNFPLSPEDVFSTYLYEGTGATQTITNEINLSGEGGLVWIKDRDSSSNSHFLYDTERGVGTAIKTDGNNAAQIRSTGLTAFNSNGFTLGSLNAENSSGNSKVSWTFRKAPKFFDVVTYTGTGSGGLVVNHNLGATPGMIVVKKTSDTGFWRVWHTAKGNAYGNLDLTSSFFTGAQTIWGDGSSYVAPTDTSFTVGTDHNVNSSGQTYVAYLFAHNDGDGEFGPDGDADIIKCGSYTGNGSTDGVTVDLGWEPQWLLFKDTTNSNDWIVIDNMRGMVVDNDLANADAYLRPNAIGQEGASTFVEPTATGFKVQNNGWTDVNGATIIYIAIRRGPMKVPTVATDVFAIDTYDAPPLPTFESSFVTDMALYKHSTLSQDWKAVNRLSGKTRLVPNATTAETGEGDVTWDFMDGWYSNSGTASTVYSWMWKRAPNFCDVVAYTGTGSTMTINHNLGVTPEMIWTKRRDSTGSWIVYHSATGLNNYLFLNSTAAVGSAGNYYAVSDTTFGAPFVNSGGTFISYLFASLDGVSKVGSYTGNGSSQTIDCGFSAGARFVLLKRTDSTGDWMIYDSTRGITSTSNDPALALNNTDAQFTENAYFGADVIRPHSSGFIIDNYFASNGHTYIFYAIA